MCRKIWERDYMKRVLEAIFSSANNETFHTHSFNEWLYWPESFKKLLLCIRIFIYLILWVTPNTESRNWISSVRVRYLFISFSMGLRLPLIYFANQIMDCLFGEITLIDSLVFGKLLCKTDTNLIYIRIFSIKHCVLIIFENEARSRIIKK